MGKGVTMTTPIPISDLVKHEWKSCNKCEGGKFYRNVLQFNVKCEHCQGHGVEPVLVESLICDCKVCHDKNFVEVTCVETDCTCKKSSCKLQLGKVFEVEFDCKEGYDDDEGFFTDCEVLTFLPIHQEGENMWVVRA